PEICSEQMVGVAPIIAAIVNVASVIEYRVHVMRDEIFRTRRPASIPGTLEEVIIRSLSQRRIRRRRFDAGIRFDQFLEPPPQILSSAINDNAILGRRLVPI